MEPDQVDILALPVLRDLQQIDEPQESRLSRQLWSDFLKADLLDGIHFNLALLHLVPVAGFDARGLPYPDTASNLSPANPVAKPLSERHQEILHRANVEVSDKF